MQSEKKGDIWRKKIIKSDLHGGLGDDPKAKVLAAQCGRQSTYQKLA